MPHAGHVGLHSLTSDCGGTLRTILEPAICCMASVYAFTTRQVWTRPLGSATGGGSRSRRHRCHELTKSTNLLLGAVDQGPPEHSGLPAGASATHRRQFLRLSVLQSSFGEQTAVGKPSPEHTKHHFTTNAQSHTAVAHRAGRCGQNWQRCEPLGRARGSGAAHELLHSVVGTGYLAARCASRTGVRARPSRAVCLWHASQHRGCTPSLALHTAISCWHRRRYAAAPRCRVLAVTHRYMCHLAHIIWHTSKHHHTKLHLTTPHASGNGHVRPWHHSQNLSYWCNWEQRHIWRCTGVQKRNHWIKMLWGLRPRGPSRRCGGRPDPSVSTPRSSSPRE